MIRVCLGFFQFTTLCGFDRLATLSQPIRSKTKLTLIQVNRDCACACFPALDAIYTFLRVLSPESFESWFIVWFGSVVIGQSDCFSSKYDSQFKNCSMECFHSRERQSYWSSKTVGKIEDGTA